MTQKKVIGIDFGGTKIKIAVVAEDGKIHGEEILVPTESNRPARQIIETMKTGILNAASSADLKVNDLDGIGIGSPGPLDLKNGIILDTPNLSTMKNFPLKNAIEKIFKLPVELNNDGNCFVLGEAYFGAGKNAPIVGGVTLGTGFGCGIVFNKHIYIGATGTAAEVWCSPYADSNFEEYGSGRTVVRIYEQKTGEKLGAKEIYFLAQKNDQHAKETFVEFGKNLGRILSIMVNLLDPDVFVVGGSISNAWEFFEAPLLENLYKNINDGPREHISVQRALLGDNSGLLGAAALLFS
jgi:glucokinase